MFLTILGISICLRANLGLFRELGGKKQKSAKPTVNLTKHYIIFFPKILENQVFFLFKFKHYVILCLNFLISTLHNVVVFNQTLHKVAFFNSNLHKEILV